MCRILNFVYNVRLNTYIYGKNIFDINRKHSLNKINYNLWKRYIFYPFARWNKKVYQTDFDSIKIYLLAAYVQSDSI